MRTLPRKVGAALLAGALFAPCTGAQDKPEKDAKPAPRQERAQEPAPKPDPQQQELARLKERMRARYADLERMRDAGKVGETWDGKVAVVKATYESEKVDPKDAQSQTVGQLVAAENGDRDRLYAILAKELKTTAAEVAEQNGLRNLAKAGPDHWLRLKDGRWVQRKDIKPSKDERPADR